VVVFVPVPVPGPIVYDHDERDTAFDQIFCTFNSDCGEREVTRVSRWYFAASLVKAVSIAE